MRNGRHTHLAFRLSCCGRHPANAAVVPHPRGEFKIECCTRRQRIKADGDRKLLRCVRLGRELVGYPIHPIARTPNRRLMALATDFLRELLGRAELACAVGSADGRTRQYPSLFVDTDAKSGRKGARHA